MTVTDVGRAATRPARSSDGRRQRKRTRWIWIILGLGTAYYLANLVAVMHAGRSDNRDPAQAIVVLGAAQYNGRPSRQLAARIDHAITLYRDGVAPIVMVTGGNQQGDTYTEAETSRNYLIEHGLPERSILAEDKGTNTYNSLQHAAEILHAHEIDSVVLVTDPFHAERSELIASEVGLDAQSSPTPTSVLGPGKQFRRELVEAGGVSVGRIIGFGRLSGLTG